MNGLTELVRRPFHLEKPLQTEKTTMTYRSFLTSLVILLLAFVIDCKDSLGADARDWIYWRGPESNGVSRETGLIDNWDPAGGEGSNVLWKRPDCGSRSTPIVMNGKVYFPGRCRSAYGS